MSLYEKVLELCAQNRTPISKLEKAVGIANGSILNWKKSYPSIDKVERIADYFNVSIDSLLGRSRKKIDLEELSIEVGVRVVKLLSVLQMDARSPKADRLAEELTLKLIMFAIQELNSGRAKTIQEALA